MISVHPVEPVHIPELFKMIQTHAAFEGLSDQVQVSPKHLLAQLCGSAPIAYAWLALESEITVGYAVALPLPYIKRGQSKLLLEDLFVKEAYRGQGAGRQLMTALTTFALERGYFKIEWRVAHWNQSAEGFYQSLGAQRLDWLNYELIV